MKKHEIRQLGGPGSGYHGHKGVPGHRGGSAPSGGGGGIPEGYRTGADGHYYNSAGAALVEVGEEADGWIFVPSKKGFNLKKLRQTGLTQQEAFAQAGQFMKDHPGNMIYKVHYTTKDLKQKTMRVYANDPYQAEKEVQAWRPEFYRFHGGSTEKVMH